MYITGGYVHLRYSYLLNREFNSEKPTPKWVTDFFQSSQSTRHFVKHAVEVKIKVKNARSNPVIIAPIMLVAAKVIAKRITENKTVPRTPVKRTERIGHIQIRVQLF